MKVNKLGRCHNLGPGRIPWASFAATAHVEARFSFKCNPISCLHRAKSLVEALCLWKNLCSRKNQERKKVISKKKKKKVKKGPKKKEIKEYHSVKKRTKFPL